MTIRKDTHMESFVYIMANKYNTTLYIGVTSDLEKRVQEHKSGLDKSSFTYRYNCHKMVHYEIYNDIRYAIIREKQLKNWNRKWKDAMISKGNPEWEDLSLAWYPNATP